jgi:hypothetical protein
MAAGATFEPIATTTLGSAAASVTFSSIPGTYTDLVLVASGTATGDFSTSFQFNSDTGNNYSATLLYGTGSAAASGRNSNTDVGYAGRVGSNGSVSIHHIMNYANTTTYKTAISRGNNPSNITMANVCLWRSTSAITTVKLNCDGGNFSTGYTFTLYGIAAA